MILIQYMTTLNYEGSIQRTNFADKIMMCPHKAYFHTPPLNILLQNPNKDN